MLILPEEINKLLSISGNDVTKHGKKFFEQDRVKINRVEYISDNDYQVTTLIDEGKLCKVEVAKKSKKIDCQCSCDVSKNRNVPCKHIIATLFDMYVCYDKYINFKNDTSIEKFEENLLFDKSNYNIGEKSQKDFDKNLLVSYYENMELGSFKIENSIKLVPKIEISGLRNSNISVSFKVGRNRLYVIKDIYEFGNNFLEANKVKYGKELEIVHDINQFIEEDKILVDFVCSKTNEYFGFAKQDKYFSLDKHFASKINLRYSSLDEFFDIVKDKQIEILDYEYTDKISFVENDPNFDFVVYENDNSIEIENIIYDEYVIYDGQKYKYILYKDKLYRCSEQFSKNVIPILKEYIDNKVNKLKFSIEQATSFCEYILPKLKEHVNVECKSEIVKKYKAESLVTKLYLDIDKVGNIIAEVKFCYLKKEFNPFLATNKIKNNRNLLQEKKVKEMLSINHFKLNSKDGTLYINKDEHIYDFLEHGINMFMEKFEVMVTDKFKSKNIVNPKNVSMGLRIKNDLLELEIDDLGFDEKELTNVIKSYRQKKKFYRLKDGSFVNIDASGIDTLVNITDSIGIDEKSLGKKKIKIPKYRAIYLDEVLKLSDDINIKKDNSFKEIVRNMSYSKELDFPISAGMDKLLRQYQKVGYNWLLTLDSLRIWRNTCR